MSPAQLAIVTGLLGLWAATLRARIGPPAVKEVAVKFTHALPASLQTILLAYWAVHWSEVLTHVPTIAFQLAFAYAFDFLLAWTLRREYRPGLGPVPVVLSMNLFVWFPDILLACLAIGLALTSKALLRREGRHIFNPAVFGLTVVAFLCIGLPSEFRYQDVSHDFDRPPYMALLVFSLALIPQIRLGITPVAVGAAVAMVGTMMLVESLTGYRGGPSPWWPAWLLAITLLAGDPATIPRSSISRLLFGLFLGVVFYVFSRALLFTIGTDFFAKIVPIALANLLVPVFERAGAQLATGWATPVVRAGNRAYVATWVFLLVVVLLVSRVV